MKFSLMEEQIKKLSVYLIDILTMYIEQPSFAICVIWDASNENKIAYKNMVAMTYISCISINK